MCHVSDLREHLKVQYIFIGDEFKKIRKRRKQPLFWKVQSVVMGGRQRKEKKSGFFFFCLCEELGTHRDFELYAIVTGGVWLHFCSSCHMYKAPGLLAVTSSNSQCEVCFPFLQHLVALAPWGSLPSQLSMLFARHRFSGG